MNELPLVITIKCKLAKGWKKGSVPMGMPGVIIRDGPEGEGIGEVYPALPAGIAINYNDEIWTFSAREVWDAFISIRKKFPDPEQPEEQL